MQGGLGGIPHIRILSAYAVAYDQYLILSKSSFFPSNKPLCSDALKDIIIWILFHNIVFLQQPATIIIESHPPSSIKILVAIIPV